MQAELHSPASLFLTLWHEATQWTPSERSNSPKPPDAFVNSIKRVLSLDDATIVFEKLDQLKTRLNGGLTERDARGRKLAIMTEIDRYFYLIHPRCLFISPQMGAMPVLPQWLEEMNEQRVMSDGYYCENDHSRVIARGPLTRYARDETAANADTLEDRFAALTVVPRLVYERGRKISVVQRVLDAGALSGVACAKNAGSEKVIFIPVAQRREDLHLEALQQDGIFSVDCRVTSECLPTERIRGALEHAGQVDLAIAPEFVTTEAQADALKEVLRRKPNHLVRLIVAGSGQTHERKESRPWNEARILNGLGHNLWRQRKIFPASIKQERAAEFGLPDPGVQGMIQEHTASGDSVLIVDIDSLGRCVVLICQDIEATSMAEEIIQRFQPDWIFTPILDIGIDVGRWVHQTTFHLSAISRSRYIVACNTALAPDAATCHVGLAVGPRDGDQHDPGRLFAALTTTKSPASAPAFSHITWRSDEEAWDKTTITGQSSPIVRKMT